MAGSGGVTELPLLAIFGVGAFVMRGAGGVRSMTCGIGSLMHPSHAR